MFCRPGPPKRVRIVLPDMHDRSRGKRPPGRWRARRAARKPHGSMRASIYSAVILVSGLSVCRVVAASPDIYGRVNLTLQNSDEVSGEQVELRNNASRLGVKGELELSAGLKAIYQLEFGVNIDGDSEQDTITHRNQFVGLEGAFGTFKAGRHDTALKESQGDFDLFDDLEGDIAGVFNGENRLRNYLGYTSPALGNAVHVTVNLFPGEDAQAGDDGLADGASISIDYQVEALYLAAAFDQDLDGEDVETARLVGGYTWGAAQLMLLYQRTDAVTTEDGFGVSLAWTLGKYVAKFQYLAADQWRTGLAPDPRDDWYESLVSVGLDRKLGEDTRLFAFLTRGDIGAGGGSDRYAAFGIEHDF
jgi:predicted porin